MKLNTRTIQKLKGFGAKTLDERKDILKTSEEFLSDIKRETKRYIEPFCRQLDKHFKKAAKEKIGPKV